ncbi:6799_t:CDS:2 [Diversispora eburnea]|uniref:6799_t:CDS:1 n=1 Tax=Diversispora eburnea TaxID=1213867 RepID=A0A9N8ZJC3_9GLOM|nr:6799_t:CDS:2 [Diversispora eburnea]
MDEQNCSIHRKEQIEKQIHVRFSSVGIDRTETTTLIVKNLPDYSEPDLLEFLKHYGPQNIRLGKSPQLKNSAFLDFPDRLSATNAFYKIQELGDICGKRIRVEYALPMNYPSNPTLHYRYPPPTVETLQNIMNAITAVPKLYTQVLHLMNKMNLPPPFGPVVPESIPSLVNLKQQKRNSRKKIKTTSSNVPLLVQPLNTSQPSLLNATTNVMSSTPTQFYDMSINVGINTGINTGNVAGIDTTSSSSNHLTIKQLSKSTNNCITIEEINKNKMPIEGRMRGQAFIKFPTEEQATQALNELHGYLLHDKPMVIHFSSKVQSKG